MRPRKRILLIARPYEPVLAQLTFALKTWGFAPVEDAPWLQADIRAVVTILATPHIARQAVELWNNVQVVAYAPLPAHAEAALNAGIAVLARTPAQLREALRVATGRRKPGPKKRVAAAPAIEEATACLA